MTIAELRQKLEEEGCSPSNYAIESRGSDAYCLMHDGKVWSIFYSERGCDSDPIFTTESQPEACTYFLELMRTQRHWHLVGVFATDAEAREFEQRVVECGAKPVRNDIPARILGVPQYRVFVLGRDIHLVKSIKQ
ncbi:MAG: hypothetical protein RL088_2013 [Verrucomicrobiota bacterium]|jgi:hypothetical protein